MTVRNDLVGGSDINFDETNFESDDYNDTNNAIISKVYGDNTGGSINNTATETDLCTITISQNDLNDNATLVISTDFRMTSGGSGGASGDFKLYIGGSAVKTVSITGGEYETGGNINYVATGIDCTAGNVIVKLTGRMDSATTSYTYYSTGLSVAGHNR